MTYDDMMELKIAAEKALDPMRQWAKRCHEASIALIRSGAVKDARVARGTCKMVPGQHSWVVVGDPYNPKLVLDPTLWSYTNVVPEVWVGDGKRWQHKPHGTGNIFFWGRPENCREKDAFMVPEPKGGWSDEAKAFLDLMGPIDMDGWRVLAHAPQGGWPAKEIMTQMCKIEALRMAIPIDIRGMVVEEVSELYPRS